MDNSDKALHALLASIACMRHGLPAIPADWDHILAQHLHQAMQLRHNCSCCLSVERSNCLAAYVDLQRSDTGLLKLPQVLVAHCVGNVMLAQD